VRFDTTISPFVTAVSALLVAANTAAVCVAKILILCEHATHKELLDQQALAPVQDIADMT